MGKPTGFIEFPRQEAARRPVAERIHDHAPVTLPFTDAETELQAARCMDCGVPFCTAGCPLGNHIPEWNHLVYQGRWREAWGRLRATNNFPEFTGRICPAPCESACVLDLLGAPVTIEHIEEALSERAWQAGWIVPTPPARRTGKTVAVVGSGPAGLACADQLNRVGHVVTVYERDEVPGGLLRFGIPDFKLDKAVVARRIALMEAEGVQFVTSAHVGQNVPLASLRDYDALVLCVGATCPRDLPLPGRDLEGIHLAGAYLSQHNRRVAGLPVPDPPILATGRHVLVIGGGDTASDCIGTARRQGAASITQLDRLPQAPATRPAHQPWPLVPMVLSWSTSQEEGVERNWQVFSQMFVGAGGCVAGLETIQVEPRLEADGQWRYQCLPGTERVWEADLILIAAGYVGPEPDGVLAQLGLVVGAGGIDTVAPFQTALPGVFVAGDARRGASLVVTAIAEGRQAAHEVDAWLDGRRLLPVIGAGDLPRARRYA
jgi:glutamate synthase (NADPH/NADH) small chain